MFNKHDRKILLQVGDGPEAITIYTSEDQGVVDWSETFPAVYVDVSIWGASASFGPFSMRSVYKQLVEALHLKEPV